MGEEENFITRGVKKRKNQRIRNEKANKSEDLGSVINDNREQT